MTEHRDNYLLLRHLAALLVIYGHCYALTAHAPDQADLIARAMPVLYGFPVQQAIVSLFPHISPLQLLPTATLAATGFAAVSWHLIERPLLSRSPRAAALAKRSYQTRSSGTR